jgi:hypothetical protein
MDDDPVLRALGDALERDDPRLAALLRAGPSPPARPAVRAPEPPAAPPAPAPPVPAAEAGRATSRHRLRRPRTWCLVLLALILVGAAVRLGPAALAALAVLLLVASPLAACWWCAAAADDLRPPEQG